MREHILLGTPGKRGSTAPIHAAWKDAPDVTLCGYASGERLTRVSGSRPTCDFCWTALKRAREAERAQMLQEPGSTLLGSLASLLPPVVEDVVIPTSVEPVVLDLSEPYANSSSRSTNTNKMVSVWLRALEGLRRIDPAPACDQATFVAAVGGITRVEVVAGTFVVPLDKRLFGVLAPFKTMIEQAVRESGVPGALVALAMSSPEAGYGAEQAADSAPLTLTEFNRTALRSLVMSEFNQQRKNGSASDGDQADKDAHDRALAEVAKIVEPPCSVDELREFLNAGLRVVLKEARASRAERTPAVHQLMREWLETHDYLPESSALAHFGPYTPQAYDNARGQLVREGYQFDRELWGWRVAARPETAEERELRQLELAQRELQARIEAARLAVEQQRRRRKEAG